RPMVKSLVTLSPPKTPSAIFTPYRSDSTCTTVPDGQYSFGRQSSDGQVSPSWVIQAQAPSTFGVVVIVTCCSISALSAGAAPKRTMTGAATPTTAASPGEILLVNFAVGVTVVWLPAIGTFRPSVPVADPAT